MMFSSRFKWNLATNQLTKLIEEKKQKGVKLLDLTVTNPTRIELNYPAQELLDALSQHGSLRYDPNPRGLPTARKAIADYYQVRGQYINDANIFLTASTSEAYTWLFKLMTNPGDTILVPQPSYPLFDFLAVLENIELYPYQLNYIHPRGWAIDFDSLTRAVSARTRAMIVVNPNNPTGSYLKQKELNALQLFCRSHDLALIIDEVFYDYSLIDDIERAADFQTDSALTFVLNGFSKMLALPQMKLGWIISSGPDALLNDANARLELIADTFLSVNTPVQVAAPEWFKCRERLQQPIIERVSGNLAFLKSEIEQSACRLLRIEGGWSAVVEIPRIMPEDQLILHLLADANVLVHPGYFFDFKREGFLVLSLLPTPDVFQAAVGRVLAQLRN